MNVKLLTEHHLEFLSFKKCCTGSSVSTLVKMPHCWKSHVVAQHEILVIIAYGQMPLINTHACLSSEARDLYLALSIHLHSAVFASKGYPFKNISDFTTAGD